MNAVMQLPLLREPLILLDKLAGHKVQVRISLSGWIAGAERLKKAPLEAPIRRLVALTFPGRPFV